MSKNDLSDTIAAIATPPGLGGIGIVRISGPAAASILDRVFFLSQTQEPVLSWESHHLYYGQVYHPQNGKLIDEALAVLMRAPHSYTAEDVAEVQCHGGPVCLAEVLAAVLASGARLAGPGEFTMRAFLNGRLDLAQAEAVLDLIEAKTPQSATLAAGQLSGTLSRKIIDLGDKTLDLLAEIAAAMDFPEDVDNLASQEALERISYLEDEVAHLLAGAHAGRIYREGLSIVLLGAPNAGKSSLMNALLKEDRVIVTHVPGTTRDVIEEYLDIEGIPVLLSDTAGLRESTNEVESIGIGKSISKAKEAGILLLVIDASSSLQEEVVQMLDSYANNRALILLNKCDIADPTPLIERLEKDYPGVSLVILSAKTRKGLSDLRTAIVQKALGGAMGQREGTINNLRHQEALYLAANYLQEARKTIEQGLPLDMASVDLQAAWQALGEISGQTTAQDVIDKIFANFCLGK